MYRVSVVVVGLNHEHAPLEVLEQVAISSSALPHALDLLAKSDHLTEAVVLSTCMRTEVYVDAVRFHGAVTDIAAVFAKLSGLPIEELARHGFEAHDHAAHTHLFRVAAGLESSVVGETEVLGQVGRALHVAQEHGTAKSILSNLFRFAVEVGRRARNETGIARGVTSIGHAAVVMAQQHLGDLGAKRVLVVGAGDMGKAMTAALPCAKDAGEIVVCNRTMERAEALRARVGVGCRAAPFADLQTELAHADVVLTSTGADKPILTEAWVAAAMANRPERPLVIVDVAVPRDVAARAGTVPGVVLLDLDDLHRFTAAGVVGRVAATEAVEAIVDEELQRYVADVAARSVAPVITALRRRVEEIRVGEIHKQRHRLAAQSATDTATDSATDTATDSTGAAQFLQREVVDALTISILAKVLHEPSVRLKAAAGTPEGERMAEALRLLFNI